MKLQSGLPGYSSVISIFLCLPPRHRHVTLWFTHSAATRGPGVATRDAGFGVKALYSGVLPERFQPGLTLYPG